MSCRRPPWCVHAALAVAFVAAFHLGGQWNARLVISPVAGQLLASQASGFQPTEAYTARLFQHIRKSDDFRSSEYGFLNFNQDKIRFSYQVSEADFRKYDEAFGYRTEDLDDLKKWRENARQSAFKIAVKTGKPQAQLDAAVTAVDKEYAQKLRDYMKSKGFRVEEGNVARVDMPAVVRNNGPLIKTLALTLERFATQRKYRSADIIGTVLSFVQTAMHYRQPDPVYKGKHTGGFLPPITAVLSGWGDCDTKTAVAASILSNWAQMRMLGISVPGHYLMAVLQIPDQGDMFVEHQGLQYLLLEPAGPAWLPPGRVAEETVSQLNAREGYKIEPFF
ncbi:MAG TPA: hypothetical protein DCZ01_06330 [Elusimicrobia bacterium]|nr:MAG: hypothetical protein A2X37_11085 [Elusimicrobia bacterium GWA2_66_18]OGR75061.1 MAG: hypothetical protein A2X40_02420 [Elusimicrobia bacterium GWC2_65_9]HAZ08131.1 hypothetical protein [Elusimicrobiota bacterium]